VDKHKIACYLLVSTVSIRIVRIKEREQNSPGLHASNMYFPSGAGTICSGGTRGSKPIPPCGSLTKRFVTGLVRCDPGRKESAPFSGVHFSNAIQKPRAVGGSVYCMFGPCH
jgi:hypothetical protein